MIAYEFDERQYVQIAPVFGLKNDYDYLSADAPGAALARNEERIQHSEEFQTIVEWLEEHPEDIVPIETERDLYGISPEQAARIMIDEDNRSRIADALSKDADTPDPNELLCASRYFWGEPLNSWQEVQVAMEWYDASLSILVHAANGQRSILDQIDAFYA